MGGEEGSVWGRGRRGSVCVRGEEGSVCGRGRRGTVCGGKLFLFFFFKPGTVAVAHRPLLDGSLVPLVHAREVDDRMLNHTPHCTQNTQHLPLVNSSIYLSGPQSL